MINFSFLNIQNKSENLLLPKIINTEMYAIPIQNPKAVISSSDSHHYYSTTSGLAPDMRQMLCHLMCMCIRWHTYKGVISVTYIKLTIYYGWVCQNFLCWGNFSLTSCRVTSNVGSFRLWVISLSNLISVIAKFLKFRIWVISFT